MEFTKYHGLGNDFIFIEDLGGNLISNGETLAKSLCHRQFGIGGDGLVLVTRPADLFIMRIFNADGTEAQMCGNAVRCMAHYLIDRGLQEGPLLEIGTNSGTKQIVVHGEQYVVDMGEPDFTFNQGNCLSLEVAGTRWDAYPVSMGNPHGVIFVDDLDKLEFSTWGPLLETHSIWPDKANIEFTQIMGPNHLQVKVWERGAGPTLACGTGASAATVIATKLGLVEKGPIKVSLPGGDLLIEWTESNQVLMTGPATKVFTGWININNLRK